MWLGSPAATLTLGARHKTWESSKGWAALCSTLVMAWPEASKLCMALCRVAAAGAQAPGDGDSHGGARAGARGRRGRRSAHAAAHPCGRAARGRRPARRGRRRGGCADPAGPGAQRREAAQELLGRHNVLGAHGGVTATGPDAHRDTGFRADFGSCQRV